MPDRDPLPGAGQVGWLLPDGRLCGLAETWPSHWDESWRPLYVGCDPGGDGVVQVRRDDLKLICSLYDEGDTTVTPETDDALERLFLALEADRD